MQSDFGPCTYLLTQLFLTPYRKRIASLPSFFSKYSNYNDKSCKQDIQLENPTAKARYNLGMDETDSHRQFAKTHAKGIQELGISTLASHNVES